MAAASLDVEKAHSHPLWFNELNGFREHVPETAEDGSGTFVDRARRPFAPQRLDVFVKRIWPGRIRARPVPANTPGLGGRREPRARGLPDGSHGTWVGRHAAAIRAALDVCLVAGHEPVTFDPGRCRTLPDPLPAGRHADVA